MPEILHIHGCICHAKFFSGRGIVDVWHDSAQVFSRKPWRLFSASGKTYEVTKLQTYLTNKTTILSHLPGIQGFDRKTCAESGDFFTSQWPEQN